MVILALFSAAPLLAFPKDAALIVAKNSKVTVVQSAAFVKAFKSAPARLANGQEVILVVKALNLPETQVVGSKLLAQLPEGLNELAARQTIILATSDAEVIRIVSSMPNAVGVVDIYSITSAIVVMKVDGKLPLEPGYLLHYNWVRQAFITGIGSNTETQ
ncbi:MAG: hypothetical protein WAK23_04640 [Terriglobales bacterium]